MKNDFKKISSLFIKKNEWIIYYALSKYPWALRDEDVLQEARIWLCEAKSKFNKERSVWKTFASSYVKWAYLNHLRFFQTKGRSQELNGYTSIGIDFADENYLCSDKESMVSCTERNMTYDSMIDSIQDPRSKEIVLLHTMGMGPTEIGKRYGITKQRIWQIYTKEMSRIKELLKEE
jgi:RNA polymerase sigma factor (sigma-70 family)